MGKLLYFLITKAFDRNSLSYALEQNSMVEQDNQILMKMVQCMFFNTNLDNRFLGKALNSVVYTLNKVTSQMIHGCTPFQKWCIR